VYRTEGTLAFLRVESMLPRLNQLISWFVCANVEVIGGEDGARKSIIEEYQDIRAPFEMVYDNNRGTGSGRVESSE
jgi:hypothetical protein